MIRVPLLVLLLAGWFVPEAKSATTAALESPQTVMATSTPRESAIPPALPQGSSARIGAQGSAGTRAPLSERRGVRRSDRHSRAFRTSPPAKRLDLRLADQDRFQSNQSSNSGSPADEEVLEIVSVTAGPTLPAVEPDTSVSATGLGALYWATRHLGEAWRVLLPVVPTAEEGTVVDDKSVPNPLPAPATDCRVCLTLAPGG